MTESATIGLDIGGTKVAGAILTADGELIGATKRPTLVNGARDPGLRVTRAVTEELCEVATARGLCLDGIGAGFPEFVDPHGRLTSSEVLAWTTQPAELLSDLGPVTVEADVRCAALGEGALGVARGLDDFAFVIIGTGLSYALVQGGRARTGARGEAIALGELEVPRTVDSDTLLSLERYASGEGIRERYVATTGRAVDGATGVLKLASNGDKQAAAIRDSAARAVGSALATMVRLLDPGAIVIGGGVSTAAGSWRTTLQEAYAAAAAARPSAPPILWAELGSHAGIIGAAIAHRRRLAAAR